MADTMTKARRQPDWLPDMPGPIQDIYAYWNRKRDERVMPARTDLDPIEMKTWLPNLLLIDVVPDDRLYVYRLVGTREVQLRGKDPTGLPVIENSFCESAGQALRNYDQVVLSKAPWYDTTPLLSADRQRLSLESIFLPLSETDAEVDKILVYAVQKDVDLPIVC